MGPFELPIRVYYEDTDAQGVVYYANYFRFMERARTEWLRSLGVDMVKLQDEDRRIFVVAEVNTRFHSPARLSDELVVTAELKKLTRVTFDIEQKIFRDTSEGEMLISGTVKAAYLDADTMRPRRVPPDIFEETS
ncbi:MAG: tol-pal system-associated acyl-CoA thioesterase [Gammaproteobacteria bacterium]|nr:tol-pal system-associated acyl-CoA thioesterase [Gammaproteobacteria bacterium]MBT8104911.1 tol-pal system-associated acyl-CoA thioesterase [Gammaproteobacteria bacterium]NNF48958.1 tol-pal system-associated acyl-CoA thioesterase [Woeseiaceae bacterium]NNK24925.1 tol-pal system-associated acyl-CoA thioesterase [Woeseiaceae bacterium]NNL63064.1 tol-pal system-associated acyl-CoA thioesterase [Woeseiaceae bacterium]